MKTFSFMLILILAVSLSTSVSSGSTGCSLKGKKYPVGSEVKGYVCNKKGRWVKK